MSKPPINPDKTTAGIAVDPITLDRVIPESRRPDGTVRKQIKIRPGFTPQEDVNRFRGSRQAQMDSNTLPKGHIIGWAPPPAKDTASSTDSKPMSKSAKKNAKRKEKREADKEKTIKDNWEDDDEDDTPASAASQPKTEATNGASRAATSESDSNPRSASDTARRKPSAVAGSALLAKELKKLDLSGKQ